ncbi:hypothetical protein VSH64_24835 [Amycolatopsis rhabdoformis]|uniref:Phage tail protein n=1 Tax=Amycolatopsis rhabdoformis TaxID=1448059 RepID=A0ABZ1HXJ4_9PSEU|nr:hypothetical protein [Amycolatopsis rhabdoformis]WSE26104.1 hypothetical protein VSH64_24835 [Amycolatopsis rhabdoformis]
MTFTIGEWAAGGTDEFGCRWSVPTETIFHGPARKTHTSERPFGIGGYRSRSYAAGKSFMLQGWCKPMAEPEWPLLVAARRRLMSVLSDGEQGLLVVDDGVTSRQLTVELDDADPKWDIWEANSGADWQLGFYAADPRFLSTVERTAQATLANTSTDGLNWASGSPGGLDWAAGSPGGLDWGVSGSGGNTLVITNDGTAPSWPLLTITTPSSCQNPTFTDPVTGDVFGYTGSIVAGQTLRMDCSPFNPTPVTLDGIDRTGALASASFIEIPKNSTRAIQFTGTGAGTVVATWRDADL